jgi:hypothetical protein
LIDDLNTPMPKKAQHDGTNRFIAQRFATGGPGDHEQRLSGLLSAAGLLDDDFFSL